MALVAERAGSAAAAAGGGGVLMNDDDLEEVGGGGGGGGGGDGGGASPLFLSLVHSMEEAYGPVVLVRGQTETVRRQKDGGQAEEKEEGEEEEEEEDGEHETRWQEDMAALLDAIDHAEDAVFAERRRGTWRVVDLLVADPRLLHYAVRLASEPVVEEVLERTSAACGEENTTEKEAEMATLLQLAVANRRAAKDIVPVLLERATAAAVDVPGDVLLQRMFQSNPKLSALPEVVTALLQRRQAQSKTPTAAGEDTVLAFHALLKNSSVTSGLVSQFVEGADASVLMAAHKATGDRPLHAVCRNVALQVDVLQRVLALDPRAARQQNQHGLLPLHLLLQHNENPSPSLLALLLVAYPRALSVASRDGSLPLHAACANPHCTPLLLYKLVQKNEAAASTPNAHQELPLHLLLQTADNLTLDHMDPLIDAHYDAMRTTGRGGNLPLHCACSNPRVPLEVLDHLANALPQLARMDNDGGALPLHLLVQFHEALNVDMVTTIVDAHPGAIETADLYGNLPLHYACTNPCIPVAVLKQLLGLHPEAAGTPNDGGSLPLHTLLQYNQGLTVRVVSALLSARPEAIKATNDLGMLPLHCAALCWSMPREVFSFVLDQGPAALRVRDGANRTVMHLLLLGLRSAGNMASCTQRSLIALVVERDRNQLLITDTRKRLPIQIPAVRSLLALDGPAQRFFTGTNRLPDVRVHICGCEGCGKTSLCAVLGKEEHITAALSDVPERVEDRSRSASYIKTRTMGVRMTSMQLPKSRNSIMQFAAQMTGQTEAIALYDHGGQDRFHALRASLFGGLPGIFVVILPTKFPFGLDGDDSDRAWGLRARDVLELWLRQVDTVADSASHVIVACNFWEGQDPEVHERRFDLVESMLQLVLEERSATEAASTADETAEADDGAGPESEDAEEGGQPASSGSASILHRLPYVYPRVQRINVNPSRTRNVRAFQEHLHNVCSRLRHATRVPRICRDAISVVRELRESKGDEYVATVGEIHRRLRSAVPEDVLDLEEEHAAEVLRAVERFGEVQFLSPGRVVVSAHWFGTKILAQVFSQRMALPVEFRPQDDEDAAPPFNILDGRDSRYVVSTDEINEWAVMPAGGDTLARDALFQGDAEALPELLSDRKYCACVHAERDRAGVLRRFWLPLFQLDDALLSVEAVRRSMEVPDEEDVSAASEPEVWVRVGRRVQCSHHAQTMLPEVMMRAQADLLHTYVELDGRDDRERANYAEDAGQQEDEGELEDEAEALEGEDWYAEEEEEEAYEDDELLEGENTLLENDTATWSINFWADGIYMHRTADSGEQMGVLVRRLKASSHQHVVDVYATGRLHKLSDFAVTFSGGGSTAQSVHILQELADEAAAVIVRAMGDVATRVSCLRLSDEAVAKLEQHAPEEDGGTPHGLVVAGDISAFCRQFEAEELRDRYPRELEVLSLLAGVPRNQLGADAELPTSNTDGEVVPGNSSAASAGTEHTPDLSKHMIEESDDAEIVELRRALSASSSFDQGPAPRAPANRRASFRERHECTIM